MSRSPERISSYRRHFEDNSSSTYQVRVSSPSPTRRQACHASAGYSARSGSSSMRVDSVGRRTASAARRSRTAGFGASAGALVCVGPSGERPMDLDAAAAESQEFLSTRTSERQEMIVLNDRLAVYIDKVRSLEQKNKLLEAEIEAYQGRFEKPTGLRLLYEEQLKELKRIADQMKVQRDISLAAKETAAAQLEAIKIKYEEAVELRKKAELEIEAFRPDVDKATSSRFALEKKLEQLEVEIEFLKRLHQQEIDELLKQIYSAHVSAQSAFTLPDLAGALKQIQTQYDDIAAKNIQEMDLWYKNKFEDLTQKSSRHVDKVRSVREEIANAKKDIQSKERDLDSLRTRNEALEARIREREKKYKKELEDLQARIEALQLELKSTKEKIALHLRKYQELLNIKMALEIEITTYRKLIEGEDLRLSGMMQSLSLTSCSMSAISAGVSLSGGSMDAVGGRGGGLMGDSRGVAGMVSGVGMSGDIVTGGTGSSPGTGGLTERIGARDTDNSKGPNDRGGVAGITGSQVVGARGLDVRTNAKGVGTDTSIGGVSVGGLSGVDMGGLESQSSGPGTSIGGVGGSGLGFGSTGPSSGIEGVGVGAMTGIGDSILGSGSTGSGIGTGGVGTGDLSSGSTSSGPGIGGVGVRAMTGAGAGGLGSGTTGSGTDIGGADARGMSDVAASGLGSEMAGPGIGIGGVGTGGVGMGSGVLGVGPEGLDSGVGGLSSDIRGLDTVVEGAGLSSGRLSESSVGGVGLGAGGDTTDLPGGMSDMGNGFGRGNGVVGGGKSFGVGGILGKNGSKAQGHGPTVMKGGIRDSAGYESKGGDDGGVAQSVCGGMSRISRGNGDMSGAQIGNGSDRFDGITEAYAEQAVELTERRTVLIRTVKTEDDVLEMDHQEQTYTISGAADDSDVE
ncbi:keratin, type II cytoskeletal 2 epidermal [Nematolebias whitei]|uniref:keratin, type II cytoskeletal 2 epidermal n=1 Tax=Nematolebias whitei TaxID=451745 RepID=UPI00189BF1C1|nr:keratin, type II cytoskeletal 2 epidermal [Nematolebias whitei]